jgi:NADH-quinone oxidoreductase subunit F
MTTPVRILDVPPAWPAVTLARAGAYDPAAGLAAAEERGAWVAWRHAVDAHNPEALVRLIDEAGLVGRGGAGYPTARKWRTCRAQASATRYAVGNGYDATPGSAVERTLMERDPHAVVEGLALTAYAVGAREAILAVRADFALAVERLRDAVAQAEDAGYIGTNAMDAGFDLVVEVRPLRGAAIIGEETALLRALEGKRAMPDQRPPHPEVRGLFGKPTVVHSVETLAAIPWIVERGPAAFTALGRGGHKGTKLVHLSGAVKRPGIAEVPLGTPLREIIEAVGGGIADGSGLKAVLVGGPAGGFLPPELLPTPLDPAALQEAGALMGSGTIAVLDQGVCIVDLGRILEQYMSEEACGKCVPCRIGTRRLFEIVDRIASGRARPTDRALLLDLAAVVRDGSLCGHGVHAPNPLVSGLRYFAAEYEAHLGGVCPAGVCRNLKAGALA